MKMTDQEFEEIKKLYSFIAKMPRGPFPDEMKELDRKWAPIDVVNILIDSLNEAKAKLKILQTPLSTIATQIEGYIEENRQLKEKLKIGHPLSNLPDCMMPDGADPCAGFQNLNNVVRETEELKKALRFYAGLEHDAHWDGNKFLAFDKFGHFDPLAAGPTVALQALGESK